MDNLYFKQLVRLGILYPDNVRVFACDKWSYCSLKAVTMQLFPFEKNIYDVISSEDKYMYIYL